MRSLLVLDYDDTMNAANSAYYKKGYVETARSVVLRERGEEGLQFLEISRKASYGYCGAGLVALNIPYALWEEEILRSDPFQYLNEKPDLVDLIRQIDAEKVIYSGSSIFVVQKGLKHLGFIEEDFSGIVGWQAPEIFPVKWSGSPIPYDLIKVSYRCSKAWMVGDSYNQDIRPSELAGFTGVLIGKDAPEHEGLKFPTVEDFCRWYLANVQDKM